MKVFSQTILGVLLAIALFSALTSKDAVLPRAEESVWVYGLFAGNAACPVIEQRLAALPLRETAILSVEGGGAGFLLDLPGGSDRLRCAIDALARQHRRAKLLLLQDTSYLSNDTEAVRRMRAVASFAGQYPGVAAAVVDLEPYEDDAWGKGTQLARRAIAFRFTRVLRQLKEAARPLRLEAAIPWWLPGKPEIPELAAQALFDSVDGVYLMAYGFAGDSTRSLAQRIARRLPPNDPTLRNGRFYLTLTTEDEPSPEQLDRDIAVLRAVYRRAPGFAGISVFHASNSYATAARAPGTPQN